MAKARNHQRKYEEEIHEQRHPLGQGETTLTISSN